MPRRKLPGEPVRKPCSFSMEKDRFDKFVRNSHEVFGESASSVLRKYVLKCLKEVEKHLEAKK